MMSIEVNKEIAKKFYETFCTADAQTAFDMMADDCTWTIMSTERSARNAQPLVISHKHRGMSKQEFIDMLLETGMTMHPKRNPNGIYTNGVDMKVWRVAGEGDHVSVEASATAALNNGETYDSFYCVHMIIKDGKIQCVREYGDTAYDVSVLS